jgi:NosR/NirI family nitrous oxide reductase transcriptional regulator
MPAQADSLGHVRPGRHPGDPRGDGAAGRDSISFIRAWVFACRLPVAAVLLAFVFAVAFGAPVIAQTAVPLTCCRISDYLSKVELSEIFPGAEFLGPVGGTPPAAATYKGHELLGYVYLNSDVVSSIGYSGKPISIVIGIDKSGKIVGAKLVEHHEPIVLVGIPPAKVEAMVRGYVGRNFLLTPPGSEAGPGVDIISGATVTSMVIDDSIRRSVIAMARSRGLGGAEMAAVAAAPAVVKKIDESKSAVEDWTTLLGDGSVRRLHMTVGEINEAFAKSSNPLAAQHPEEGPDDDVFIDLYVALASVPTIGRSLLGDSAYKDLKARLKPGQQAIIVAGTGRYSFKGSGYVRGGIFDRIEIVQADTIVRFRDRNQMRLGDLEAAGAPYLNEISLFTTPEGEAIDPTQPWDLKLLVQRAFGAREKAFLTFDLSYILPDKYVLTEKPPAPAPTAAAAPAAPSAEAAPPPVNLWAILTGAPGDMAEAPLWVRIWRVKLVDTAILAVAIVLLTAIFFFQDYLVRRPVLYDRVRLAFLVFTLFWIGWYADAQLSIVNILTFVNALRTDFRWEYFLVDPLIFILWFAVAAAMLFWGRGAYCGWLCPFGALQELLNRGARLLRVPQIPVPFGLHQRLWPVKYVIFLLLFGLGLYSLAAGERASEVEPFKTAIILHFAREWPFVLYAALLLGVGLFVERFFCRYVCPLGAALAIPARLRMFDWLKRYRECGNPCQRCANECPVQSIHPEGHINPNECIQCLHCQMLYHHPYKCPVVIQKRLKAERRLAAASPSMRPGAAGAPKPAGALSKES